MRTMLLLLSLFMLAGCAATTMHVADDKYMSKVERGAALSGAKIIWVNPPQKVVPVTYREDAPS
ncbi:MAG: hypothetical protein JO218_06885 [Burkholderiales bacterium]|nr:hypothetical protein [Burkholderiales bacterium]